MTTKPLCRWGMVIWGFKVLRYWHLQPFRHQLYRHKQWNYIAGAGLMYDRCHWRHQDLFQWLSVAFQRGNALSFHSTFTTEQTPFWSYLLTFQSNIYPRELSTEGQRNNNNNLLICRKQCLTHVQTCHVFQMLCLAYRCRSFVNENTVSCLVLSRSVLLPWKDEVAYPVFCAQSYTVNVVKCNMQVRWE